MFLWFCCLSASYISKSYKYSPCSPPAFIQAGYAWTVCPKWKSGLQISKVRKSLHVTVLFWIQVQCWTSFAASNLLDFSLVWESLLYLNLILQYLINNFTSSVPAVAYSSQSIKLGYWIASSFSKIFLQFFKVIWTVSKHTFSPSELDNV